MLSRSTAVLRTTSRTVSRPTIISPRLFSTTRPSFGPNEPTPPANKSATETQRPSSGVSSSTANKSNETSASDSKAQKTKAQDKQEAEAAKPSPEMNATEYGTGDAVEGSETKQAGEKTKQGLGQEEK